MRPATSASAWRRLAIAFSFSASERGVLGRQLAMRRRVMRGLLEHGIGLGQRRLRRLQFDLEQLGSIWYSGSPALTSLPCLNRRSVMMPETRGRTSATRVGAMRPGNSRTIACGFGITVTTLTSGATT